MKIRRLKAVKSMSRVLVDGLLWYSKANYTMSTEYYGDVRQFVEVIIDDPAFIQCKSELRQLLKQLDKMFGK